MNRLTLGLRPHVRIGVRLSQVARYSSVGTMRQPLPFKRAAVASYKLPSITSPVRSFSTFLDPKEVEERVVNVVKAFEKVDESKVTPSSHFANDLGLDSLDAVELVMALEEEFVIEIPDEEAERILTCEDAIKFIVSFPHST